MAVVIEPAEAEAASWSAAVLLVVSTEVALAPVEGSSFQRLSLLCYSDTFCLKLSLQLTATRKYFAKLLHECVAHAMKERENIPFFILRGSVKAQAQQLSARDSGMPDLQGAFAACFSDSRVGGF